MSGIQSSLYIKYLIWPKMSLRYKIKPSCTNTLLIIGHACKIGPLVLSKKGSKVNNSLKGISQCAISVSFCSIDCASNDG